MTPPPSYNRKDTTTTISLEARTKEKLKEYKDGTWNKTIRTFLQYFDINDYEDLIDIRYEIKKKRKNNGDNNG